MRWDYISIHKLQRLHRWSLGVDKKFPLTLYNRRNYLSKFCFQFVLVPMTVNFDDLCHFVVEGWYQEDKGSLYESPLNSSVTGEFPPQRPVTPGFDVSLICAWTNGWVNNRDACDLRRHRAHYDVTVMKSHGLYGDSSNWNTENCSNFEKVAEANTN